MPRCVSGAVRAVPRLAPGVYGLPADATLRRGKLTNATYSYLYGLCATACCRLAKPDPVQVCVFKSKSECWRQIYLDYCCRIDAGKFQVEMSPIADIETLFRHGICDPAGCALAITLAKEAEVEGTDGAPPAVDAPQRLRYIVTKRAAEAGLVAVVWPRRFSYGAMFVELFWVCEAAALPRMPEPG